MRVAIAGAGSVGRSITAELTASGHEVLLIDRDSRAIGLDELPHAEWLLADACELSSLEDARIGEFDAVVAASGDDKANLVVALLAKTQFAVPRVVARINDPANEWLFTDAWGVDIAVSPPRLLAALVEDATGVNDTGEARALMSLPDTDLLEFTLPEEGAHVDRPVRELVPDLPEDIVLVAIVRAGRVRPPSPETVLLSGDDLVFLSSAASVHELGALLVPGGDRGAPQE